MNWQETILTLGQIIFIVALVPSILSKDKPQIWTSIITGLVALSISITYLTLNIPFAAISAFLNFVAWGVLAIQKYHQIQRIAPVKSQRKR